MNPQSQDRCEHIVAMLLEHRHLSPRELARHTNVSEATIRRDLRAMAAEGRVELGYGGVTLRRASDYSFSSKVTRNAEAKRTIGRLAADLVNDGDQLFLDSGTTCFAMIPHLRRKRGLCVIVNSAKLAVELDWPGLSVILLGGQYRPDRMDTIGPLAMSSLGQLRGYTCFIGADGLHEDFGLAASDIESSHLYRLAVQHARKTVLLADHSKFGASSLFQIVDWTKINSLVTDSDPPGPWRSFLKERGVAVVTPPDQAPAQHGPDLT